LKPKATKRGLTWWNICRPSTTSPVYDRIHNRLLLELGRFQRRSKELGAWWWRFIKVSFVSIRATMTYFTKKLLIRIYIPRQNQPTQPY
jgi:hypothetical protein